MRFDHRIRLWVLISCTFISACSFCGFGPKNEQGWTACQQQQWHRASQGSRLIPYDWLTALESDETLARPLTSDLTGKFGYLPPAADDAVKLPVGFAIDTTSDEHLSISKLRWFEGQGTSERWVGMTCAACHTTNVTYRGTSIRIDGGATLADFQGFEIALLKSLQSTRDNPEKWNRFATVVLSSGNRDNARNRELLKNTFGTYTAEQEKLASLNIPDRVSQYGYGRLDAVGHILNRVAYLVRAETPFGGPPDAPVSYPFIWNAPQHDRVQWNGIAPNRPATLPSGEAFDLGALGRNTSEVIGVFADVVITNEHGLAGYASSVNVKNLDAMETQLKQLKSPVWPAHVFGPYDAALAEEGKGLFQTSCARCHTHLKNDDTKTPIVASMSPIWGDAAQEPVGTDPWMACNAFTYQARSGVLEGVPKGYFPSEEKIGKIEFTRDLLTTTAAGTLLGKKRQIAATAARAIFGLPRTPAVAAFAVAPREVGQVDKASRLLDCKRHRTDKLMAYKGRPLNGIWATAPYLHNGSVKSLYEMLLPVDQRSRSFVVGNLEFDPVHVGYVDSAVPNSSTFSVTDANGVPIDGNSNEGHDYGNAGFTEHQRLALVEYLKSL